MNESTTWGPYYWLVLHKSAAAYPDNPDEIHMDAARSLIYALPVLVPQYSANIGRYLRDNRDRVEHAVRSRTEYVDFMWRFHNWVNAVTGRRQQPHSAASGYGGQYLARPDEWGPFYWYFFHSTAHSYPHAPYEAEMRAMRSFILAVPYMLPCASCREHASGYLYGNARDVDVAVRGRSELVHFWYRFHNWVNARLGKKRA